MTDDDLADAWERCSIPTGRFSHVDHVRVAWFSSGATEERTALGD